MKNFLSLFTFLIIIVECLVAQAPLIETKYPPFEVEIKWDSLILRSKTTATLQVVENPMLRPGSPIFKESFKALKELGADYVRYVPWFPYPKMAVAELKAPTETSTSWDFTYLDSTMNNIMVATNGHPLVINFSTTPAWLWSTDSIVPYPANPYELCWSYNKGRKLRDTSCKELAFYFSSVLSWYTRGGFKDELGKFHKSGYYFTIPYWEILNEPDLEHNISVELYTKMYDVIALALKKIQPDLKFVGVSLSNPNDSHFFEYFLDGRNHKKGVAIDAISYHHYSVPSFLGQDINAFQYTCFEKTDAFLIKARFIESIRKRLAPHCLTMINELGIILQSVGESIPIPPEYWNLAAAMFSYCFVELAKVGIDVVGASQLIGYPTQFPDVSMMNWVNGKPNARYYTLKMLKDNFGPGDKLVYTNIVNRPGFWGLLTPEVQAFETLKGKKILLINKQNQAVGLQLPKDVIGAKATMVNILTGDGPGAQTILKTNMIILKPLEVLVLAL